MPVMMRSSFWDLIFFILLSLPLELFSVHQVVLLTAVLPHRRHRVLDVIATARILLIHAVVLELLYPDTVIWFPKSSFCSSVFGGACWQSPLFNLLPPVLLAPEYSTSPISLMPHSFLKPPTDTGQMHSSCLCKGQRIEIFFPEWELQVFQIWFISCSIWVLKKSLHSLWVECVGRKYK